MVMLSGTDARRMERYVSGFEVLKVTWMEGGQFAVSFGFRG